MVCGGEIGLRQLTANLGQEDAIAASLAGPPPCANCLRRLQGNCSAAAGRADHSRWLPSSGDGAPSPLPTPPMSSFLFPTTHNRIMNCDTKWRFVCSRGIRLSGVGLCVLCSPLQGKFCSLVLAAGRPPSLLLVLGEPWLQRTWREWESERARPLQGQR